MENYIGKTQKISGTSTILTVVDQKEEKIIVELKDGRFFRTDIEHWDKGFSKLNHLSDSIDTYIGMKSNAKNGELIEIIEVDKWGSGQRMKIKVRFEDGIITNTNYKSFINKTVMKPATVEYNTGYFIPVSEETINQHLGEISYTKDGVKMTVIEYINAKNITVKLDNGLIKHTSYVKFCRGEVSSLEYNHRNLEIQKQRLGEENMSYASGMMRIIEYNSSSNITVLFLNDGTTKKTSYKHFKEGTVLSNYLQQQRDLEIKKRTQLIEEQKRIREEKRDKTGESIILDNGMTATIIEFSTTHDDVKVSIGDEIVNVNYCAFKNGMKEWQNIDKRKKMVGTTVKNSLGTVAIITAFNKDNLTFSLRLDNGYCFCRKCSDVEKNAFSTPYDKTYGGVGYLGEKYGGMDYPVLYKKWGGILERTLTRPKDFPSYKGCTVCKRWLCFSNFVDDMLNMWYDCDEQLYIDKDIKYKGNKEYSPDKCLLVPHRINMLFVAYRGRGENKKHQVGVSFRKKENKWRVKPCEGDGYGGNHFRVGVHKDFDSEKEAGEYYRSIKKEYVEKILESYRGVVPDYVLNYCFKFEFDENDWKR